MKTVHKAVLALHADTNIRLPRFAEFLSVANQHDHLCLWYLCDPTEHEEERTIRVVGTGHPIDGRTGDYIGTVLFSGGVLVLHVFDLGQP